MTTDATVHRDLEASFRQRTRERIEELLNEIGHAPDDAACFAAAIPKLMDPQTLEAHVMLVADRLFQQATPWAHRRLISEPLQTRGKYIRRALEIVTLLHGAFEGQRDPDVLQAAADWLCHRDQAEVAARVRQAMRAGA